MVPSAIMLIDELPLSPSGKLDRRALPAPHYDAESAGRAAATTAEAALCELFAQVLGLPAVGADDSFFALGGDSIISIQLVSRARAAGYVFTPRDVFEAKTVARLAERAGRGAPVVAEDPDAGIGEVALLPIARHLAGQDSKIDGFCQTVTVTTPAGLTLPALTSALGVLLDHHDALRLRLTRDELGEPRPAVRERGAVDAGACLTWIDTLSDPVQTPDSCVAALQASLDPAAGRMLAAAWLDAGPNRPGNLVLAVHHLAVDGVSWRVLLPDLAAAVAGTPLAPVGTSLRTWARLLTEDARTDHRIAELPHWQQTLTASDTWIGARALDPAHDTVGTLETATVTLAAHTTAAILTSLPEAYHANVDDVLLTALATAVGGAVLVDLEGHGREELASPTDLSRTVGWFTTLYPVHLDPGGGDPGTALKLVKEQLRSVPDRGLGYGLLRHLNPETAEALAGLPAPRIGFNYLGRLSAGTEAGQPWSPVGGIGGAADPELPVAHALEINAMVLDGPDGPALTATWAWPRGAIDGDRARALADRWIRALTELAGHAGAGGYTPSDLDLVALTQDEIDDLADELEAEWGDLR
jgi:non-ribosomal peptide synthase protein (TIGR01720 family)